MLIFRVIKFHMSFCQGMITFYRFESGLPASCRYFTVLEFLFVLGRKLQCLPEFCRFKRFWCCRRIQVKQMKFLSHEVTIKVITIIVTWSPLRGWGNEDVDRLRRQMCMLCDHILFVFLISSSKMNPSTNILEIFGGGVLKVQFKIFSAQRNQTHLLALFLGYRIWSLFRPVHQIRML